MKLTDLYNEIKINIPNKFDIDFIRRNINELIEEIDFAYPLEDLEDIDNLKIEEVEIEDASFSEIIVYDGSDNFPCEILHFYDINEAYEDEDRWEGPIELPFEYTFKGVKFKAYSSGC